MNKNNFLFYIVFACLITLLSQKVNSTILVLPQPSEPKLGMGQLCF